MVGYAGAACLLPFLAAAVPAAAEQPAAGAPNLNSDFQRCRAGTIDACYDAIRWRPTDPSLLSALGDAQLRANRTADALRSYRRVAALAPNMPGVVEKISAIEARLSAKRTQAKVSAHGAAADTKRYSNAAPETQSH
jgi:predicted Zn-dependent protease